MKTVTEQFVRQELGGLDDVEVARIVALEASEAEVVEARAWLEDDEVVRSLGEPSSGVVRQILDIARDAIEDDDDGYE